jgi:hypothetical protein
MSKTALFIRGYSILLLIAFVPATAGLVYKKRMGLLWFPP